MKPSHGPATNPDRAGKLLGRAPWNFPLNGLATIASLFPRSPHMHHVEPEKPELWQISCRDQFNLKSATSRWVPRRDLANLAAKQPVDEPGVDHHNREHDDARPPEQEFERLRWGGRLLHRD